MIDPAVLRDFDAGVDAVVPTWIPEEGAPYSVTAVDVLFDNEILGDRMVYASAKWPNGQMAVWLGAAGREQRCVRERGSPSVADLTASAGNLVSRTLVAGPCKKIPFTGHLDIKKKSSMSGGTTMLAAKEQAFIDLHTQHSARVYRYIACRISDRHRAEELAADVFRIAWEKELSEPPGIGWLLATARNVIGNEYKGRRRRQELVDRLKDEARGQVPESNDAEGAAVADVLVQLRERDREVLMLSYWDELTIAELAQALGCSSSAAGVRLHRARRAFAKAAPSHLMTERKD